MYVLTRIISPYDCPNLFLGIFSTRENALKARENYLKSIDRKDPWASQSYRTVDIEADVRLIEVDDYRDLTNQSKVIYIVTAYYDSMGQIYREFLAAFSDRNSAEKFAIAIEEGNYQTAPNWCDVDEVILDVPL